MTIGRLRLLLEAKDTQSKVRPRCNPGSTYRWAFRIGHPKLLRALDKTGTECKYRLVGVRNKSCQNRSPEKNSKEISTHNSNSKKVT